jgi:hypothetical protein
MGAIRGKVREGINVATLTFLLPYKHTQRNIKKSLQKFRAWYTE